MSSTRDEKRAYGRKHYQANKAAYILRTRRQMFEKRMWVYGQKMKPCADCGKTYPPCVMDFDHRDPGQKKYEVSKLMYYNNWSRLKAEIAKCDLVCANCHRIRTHKDNIPTFYPRKRGKTPEEVMRVIRLLYPKEMYTSLSRD